MTVTTNAENLKQYKNRFSLIVEQELIFASSPDMVIEMKISKLQISCETIFYVIAYSQLDS